MASSSDAVMEPSAESAVFEGASMASRELPQAVHSCTECGKDYPFYSQLAFVDSNNEWAHVPDTTLARVTEDRFHNKVTGEAHLKCFECLGRHHKTEYVNSNGKLTSRWQNLMKSTKRSKMSKAKLSAVLSGIDAKRARDGHDSKVTVAQAYHELEESCDFRCATDFVYDICPSVSLLYGCECGSFPLMSSGWWRCSPRSSEEGNTRSGKGHWRCGQCVGRWSWATGGSLRLFTILGQNGAFVIKIGEEVTKEHEVQLNILKACSLLDQLGGVKVSVESLLVAIQELNMKRQEKIGKHLPVHVVTARDTSGTGAIAYCEDHRVSLNRVGQTYQILRMNPDELETCTGEDIDNILATAAAFMTIESYKPAGHAHTRVHKKMVERASEVRSQLSRM